MPRFGWFTSVCVLLAAGTAGGAQKLATKNIEVMGITAYGSDELLEIGLRFKPPRDWMGVPVPPGDPYLAAKWVRKGPLEVGFDGRTETGAFVGVAHPQLLLLRIPHVAPHVLQGTDENPADWTDEELERQLTELRNGGPAATSFTDWIRTVGGEEGRRWTGVQLGETSEIEIHGVAATRHTLTTAQGFFTGVRDLVSATVLHLEDADLALVYRISENQADAWGEMFQKSADSSRIIKPKKRRRAANAAASAVEAAREAARRVHQADVDLHEGWRLEESGHFFLKIHSKKSSFVKDVVKRLEAADTYFDDFFPGKSRPSGSYAVRFCADRAEYGHYGGPEGTSGFWNPQTGEIVLYRTVDEGPTGWRAHLVHEAFHRFVFERTGGMSPAPWFGEGHAVWFEQASLKGKTMKMKARDPRVNSVRAALHRGRGGKGGVEGGMLPLSELLTYSVTQFNARREAATAQAASLIHYLHEGNGRGWQKSWSRILPAYLDTLGARHDLDGALMAAFRGVDLDALEAAWHASLD